MSLEETREEILRRHPSKEHVNHKDLRFEGVLEGIIEEHEALDDLIRSLRRRLDEALAKQHDVEVVLATLKWLDEHVMGDEPYRKAIRQALSGTFDSYKHVMERLDRLFSSERFKGNGFVDEHGRRCDVTPEGANRDGRKHRMGGAVFWCPNCMLGFRDKDDMDRHVKSGCEYKGEEAFYTKRAAAEKAQKFHCEVCDFYAKNAGGLASHKRGKAHKKMVQESKKKRSK